MFPESIRPAIFIVTNVSNVVVRSNPFVEISFRLFTQAQEDVDQLRRQVRDEYRVVVTAIGTDRSLLVKKSSYFEMKDHIASYIDIADFYVSTFYDYGKAAFVFSEIYDESRDVRATVVDFMLLKLMYEMGIIVYDPVVTFALNNYEFRFERIYIDKPYLVDNHRFKESMFYRLLKKDRKSPFFEKRFPYSNSENPQMSKYLGANLIYIDTYTNRRNCDPLIGNFTVFDDEFIDRILHDKPYDRYDPRFNVTLRNPVINWFNDHEIDFTDVYVKGERSLENFYLVPMVLYMYGNYIATLK